MAASHHGDTPYSGNSVTSVPVTPYTTSVDVNRTVLDEVPTPTDQKGAQLQGGAAAPDPAAYGLSPPLFQPLTAYAAHGRIFPTPARGTPAPRLQEATTPDRP